MDLEDMSINFRTLLTAQRRGVIAELKIENVFNPSRSLATLRLCGEKMQLPQRHKDAEYSLS
jgi:hypothetical protein